MSVYCVFEVFGDGDSYNYFDLLSVCENVDVSKSYIKKHYESLNPSTIRNVTPCHPTMNETNYYTYLGKRSDCSIDGNYGCLSGFIIEEMVIQS